MRDDEFLRARFQIDVRDTAARRGHVVEETVADACVAIAGPAVGDAREITRHGLPAIRTQRIDWRRQRPLLARLHIHDVAYEAILLAVVPDDLRRSAGDPLQHATLLPAPRVRLAERDPFVLLVQIHHADLDDILRRGRAMLETDLVAQHKTVVRRELQLVVVAEPMGPRTARDLADGWKLGGVLSAQSSADGCGGERGEELAAGRLVSDELIHVASMDEWLPSSNGIESGRQEHRASRAAADLLLILHVRQAEPRVPFSLPNDRNLLSRPPYRKRSERGPASGSEGV